MQEPALPVPEWPSMPCYEWYKWLGFGVLIIEACLLQAGSRKVLFLLTGLTSSCTFKIIQSKAAQKPSSCIELSVVGKVERHCDLFSKKHHACWVRMCVGGLCAGENVEGHFMGRES